MDLSVMKVCFSFYDKAMVGPRVCCIIISFWRNRFDGIVTILGALSSELSLRSFLPLMSLAISFWQAQIQCIWTCRLRIWWGAITIWVILLLNSEMRFVSHCYFINTPRLLLCAIWATGLKLAHCSTGWAECLHSINICTDDKNPWFLPLENLILQHFTYNYTQ